MKRLSIFIIITVGVLIFQFCVEGFLSSCEQVKAEEELGRIKEPGTHKITRSDCLVKAVNEHHVDLYNDYFLGHLNVAPGLICPKKSSITLAKLFNHSPPSMMLYVA